MQKLALSIGFILGSFLGFSQGSIGGVVKDATTGETVAGANVVIQGTFIGASTDMDGNFLIPNVKEGTYSLQISFVTYKNHIVSDVVVATAQRVMLDIMLTEDVSELAEVVVTAKSHTDTDFDLLRDIKMTRAVVSGISAEQISKTLDRDASQVVRRIPGVTVKDGQFIVIRGLVDRYNAVMLNNAYAPSVETDVRSFSFASIPSAQLDKVLIYKSPAADLPGDFGGGVVKVFTKSTPEANNIVIDYSTQVRAGTTFQDFYHQQRDPGHATGFNNGYYDLPAYFPADLNRVKNSDAVLNAGRSLRNLWTSQKSLAIPDQRLTITANKNFKLGSVQIGSISTVSYSNAYATYNVERGDYTESGGKIDQNFAFQDKQYNQQIAVGFLSNWSFRINPNNNIEFKNIYNQRSNEQYVDRLGIGMSAGQVNGAFDKVYRGIYSGQLNGTHDLFGKRTSIEWLAAYNNSYRDQPDYKRFTSIFDNNSGATRVIIPNNANPNYLGRFFAKLNENAYSGGVNIKQQLVFNGDPIHSPELKAGVFFENKQRTFAARNLGYQQASQYLDPALTNSTVGELFQSQNINNTNGIQIGEISYKKNSYTASNNLLAYYAMASLPIGNKIKLDGGARIEDNLQQLHSYDDFIQQPVDPSYHIVKVLPSANLSYNFTEKALIRAAYGQTLNRPEFRELAPFSYYDFNFNFLMVGNPALKMATIQNTDLRFEFYPSKTETITFGGFYKQFLNPIERIVDLNSPGGGVKNINFANAQSATSYGVELEVKKSLYGLTGSSFIDNINVLLNATLIKSRIQLPASIAAGQDTNRPLQGQAPYVVNAALFYNNEATGWQVNMLYNVVGKSIAFVGNENYHTVYLMPRSVIDLTFNKSIGQRFQIKGGISDILNQSMLFLQDGNANGKLERKTDQTIQGYKPGQVFSIGFSVRI